MGRTTKGNEAGLFEGKALSLWQPWASAIAVGLKRVETRRWGTAYRGPLAIHAAKTTRGLALFPDLDDLPAAPHLYNLGALPRGVIVATCRLVDCVRTESIAMELGEAELMLGDYSPRRFAWVLDDVRRLPEPVPCRGARGLFDVRFSGGPR